MFLEDSIVCGTEILRYIIFLSFKVIRKDVFVLMLSIYEKISIVLLRNKIIWGSMVL
jgi:hypothetical protein